MCIKQLAQLWLNNVSQYITLVQLACFGEPMGAKVTGKETLKQPKLQKQHNITSTGTLITSLHTRFTETSRLTLKARKY